MAASSRAAASAEATAPTPRHAPGAGQRRDAGTINAMRPANTSGVCVSASHAPYRWMFVSTFAAEKSCSVAPYPDASGEPKSAWLIQAMANRRLWPTQQNPHTEDGSKRHQVRANEDRDRCGVTSEHRAES